jgi:hypothetical protein
VTAISQEQTETFRRHMLLAAPVTLAVPVALGAILVALGADLRPSAIAVGAVGWTVALALRVPVGLVSRRVLRDDTRIQTVLAASSGPCEEIVRLVVLLLLGHDLDTALSIGLGWAGIEALYATVNAFAMLALMGRQDEEAARARAMLPLPNAVSIAGIWMGVFERVWASTLHIAFTLIIAARPILVVATIVAHSVTNMAFLAAAKRIGLGRAEVLGAVWADVVLVVALVLWWPVGG